MALPTLITISGTFLKVDGSPEEGSVVFRSTVTAYHNSSSSIMTPSPIVTELNGSGAFSVQIPATNDPAWTPVGWTYKVSVNLTESVSTFYVQVPYNSPGAAATISSLSPIAPSGGTLSYASAGHTHAGYVQTADVDEAVESALGDIATTKGDILVGTGSGNIAKISVGTNGQVLKANSATATGLEWGVDGGGGGGGAVSSVAGRTGDVTLTKSDVGLANVDNTSDASKPVSTATQTALNGKQALDDDLTAIAGLSPTNNDVIQRKSGAWTNRTPAQLKTDLSLVKGDVGLGNVDNVQQQPIDSDLTAIAALTPTNDDVIQRKSGAWTNRTMAQVKTDLALVKGDVGLGNVDNTSDANKPVSTAQATAIGVKPSVKAWNGSAYADVTGSIIYVGGPTDPTVNNGDIWIDTSSATDFAVAGNLTVAGNMTVSGIGARVSRVRTTNATARTSGTLTADDVLTATLGLGTWVIKTVCVYLGSDATADFQMAYSAPTGTLYNRITNGILASNSATGAADKAINHQAALAIGTAAVFATTTTADFMEETIIYNVTTAGTFAVTWSRNAASGSATLLAGSYFTAERVA